MIQIFVDGRNFGKNHGAAFATILIGENGGRRYVWERSFDCDQVTTNQACMHGILFALHSVKKEHRSNEVELCFKNKYVLGLLGKKDGSWAKKSKTNPELLDQLREVFEEFPKISIAQSDGDHFKRAQKFSSDVAKKNGAVDNRN